MKKLIGLCLSLLVAGGAIASAEPSRRFPRDQNSNIVGHPLYGGYSYQRIAVTGAKQICVGRCLLAAVIRGTGPVTTSVQVRDTAEAISEVGILVLGSAYFRTMESSYYGHPLPPLPILFGSGIMGQLSAASTDEWVTFVYIDLD